MSNILSTASADIQDSRPYKTVYFEIVGFCNGRCPWCPTGNMSMVDFPSRTIPPSDLDNAIKRLLKMGLISTQESCVFLYNWGEPMLHPELDRILSILCEHNIHFALSTNGSKSVKLNPRNLLYLRELRFSVSGFSQGSYDRIHRFDFGTVLKNIKEYGRCVRNAGSDASLTMAYHVYQFNIGEVEMAAQFCKDNGINFMPYVANLMDYNQAKAYINQSINADLLRRVSRDLLLFYVDEWVAHMPKAYRCPQFDILTIDEFTNVVLCCALPKMHPDYSLGKLSELSTEDIRDVKERQKVCAECIGLGIAYWYHNPLFLDYSRGAWQFRR